MNPSNDGAWSTLAPAPPPTAGGLTIPRAIGLGCLGFVLMMGLLIAGVFIVAGVALRSSDAYQLALTAAQREPAVTTALGTPVRAGWFTTGEVRVAGPTGDATLEIPISGPRGSATIDVQASKSAGKWSFSRLDVRVAGSSAPLHLLAPSHP